MHGINYNGLRKKETYDELIDYVMNKQEKIKYPDRTAKFLRESPQLSNLLDGDGEGILEMEEQQKRQRQEVEKEQTIREMAGEDISAAELRSLEGRVQNTIRRPNLLRTFPMNQDDSDFESIQGSADFDDATSNLRDDISDELNELNRVEREKQEKAKEDVKNMLQTIYLGVAEKLANRPRPPSYTAPVQNTIKTINKKNSKKGSNKAGTGEAPMSMEEDLVAPKVKGRKSMIAGSTGDPEGPGKRGRRQAIKNITKQSPTRSYSRPRVTTSNFQEGGASSSTGGVEIPPSVNVAAEVKQIEAKPKAPPPMPNAGWLGGRSKSIPPAKPKAEQLGARSKSTAPTKPKAEQLGARSKTASPPKRTSQARRKQPGVLNI